MTSEDLARAERMLSGSISVAEIISYLQTDCFLTKSSAAKFIDHHDERIIEQAIRSRQLRAFRASKKILIRKSDLIAWVESREITKADQVEHKTDLQRLMDAAIEKAKANVAARKAER
jgi:hypothetical protein